MKSYSFLCTLFYFNKSLIPVTDSVTDSGDDSVTDSQLFFSLFNDQSQDIRWTKHIVFVLSTIDIFKIH